MREHDWLKCGNQIVLIGVEVHPNHLSVALGLFEKGLAEGVYHLSNESFSCSVKLPSEAANLQGRGRVFNLKLYLKNELFL